MFHFTLALKQYNICRHQEKTRQTLCLQKGDRMRELIRATQNYW